MRASKLRLMTVEVSSSTMMAGPGMMAPGARALRSWIATSMKSALSGSNTARRRDGAGREGGGGAGAAGLGIEGAEPLQLRAHDLVGDRRAQKADGRADPGVRRHQHPVEAELVGYPRGMERRRPAKRDEGAAARILAAFDRVDAC